MNNEAYIDTASRDGGAASASANEAALVARGRAAIYACLARGFAFPADELLLLLRHVEAAGGEGRNTCGRGVRRSPPTAECGDGLGAALQALAQAAIESDIQSLRRSYMRIFDPRRPPFPFEAEHRAEHFQQSARLLADLQGFYRAFGLRTDGERPDHIATELNFLHVLCLKQAAAFERGMTEQATVCEDARILFLKEHVLPWYASVCDLVRERAVEPHDRFYLELADTLDLAIRRENEAC